MDQRRRELLRIMELEFAAVELNLFLDTHPEEQRALADYNAVAQELNRAKATYESRYGPLLHFGQSLSPEAWRWIEDPWPWEITFN
ncbi:MAG: spore coat protein CotJB [Bacillota bacterium]